MEDCLANAVTDTVLKVEVARLEVEKEYEAKFNELRQNSEMEIKKIRKMNEDEVSKLEAQYKDEMEKRELLERQHGENSEGQRVRHEQNMEEQLGALREKLDKEHEENIEKMREVNSRSWFILYDQFQSLPTFAPSQRTEKIYYHVSMMSFETLKVHYIKLLNCALFYVQKCAKIGKNWQKLAKMKIDFDYDAAAMVTSFSHLTISHFFYGYCFLFLGYRRRLRKSNGNDAGRTRGKIREGFT
jgi:hypothetical protein